VMVRHGQTNKKFLNVTLSEIQTIGITGLSLLINDVRSKRSSYRYAYNYKYGSKYIKE